MNILIDINHPSHVHFFKNIIQIMKNKGNKVIVTATNKEVTFNLLKKYGIKFYPLNSPGGNILSYIKDYIIDNIVIWKIIKKTQPEIILSLGSIRATQMSSILGKTSIVIEDSEHTKIQNLFYIPFSTLILSSISFTDNYGKKHFKYNSFDELTYLHPNYFKPKKSVLKKYGLYNKKYVIIRLVSWKASHDIKQKGFDFKNTNELRQFLDGFETKNIYPIILSERPRKDIPEKYSLKIDPSDIHDLLYYATCYIGEGATLAAEAALLGTPSIYVSTISLGYLNKLKSEYNLLHACVGYKEALHIYDSIIIDRKYKDKLIMNKNLIINNVIDLNIFFVWLIEFYPYSKIIIESNSDNIKDIKLFNRIININI